jgi:hypothetical protein
VKVWKRKQFSYVEDLIKMLLNTLAVIDLTPEFAEHYYIIRVCKYKIKSFCSVYIPIHAFALLRALFEMEE